ncbi:HAD family hydrolase [Streptomyces lavenduligriseus]|uniref:HAD family hydrolase n=1 Tax=Streptomyces lavenduligriseus TaxID=67315 RepID=A0ABT0NN54_9ACTN|nr:HAD family hydrolase [Streptomyces lavenduligriseus]MCL3992233.1 HAD family hydrolase [Streptomyces lavenduligriseus]
MIQAAVFDLDGTLADTPAAIGRLLTRVCAEYGVDVTEAQVAPTIGKPLEPSVAALLGRAVDDPVTTRAVTRYRELFDTDVLSAGPALLYEGVAEGLRDLRERGLPLAVGTSKISASAEKLLAATGIRELFGPVVGNDMVRRGKPDPEMGLRAASELGVPVERCAYIGDTGTDMRMAISAGMLPVAVTYGVGAEEEFAGGGALICRSFGEVVQTLSEHVPADPVRA